ncbi:MAG TPA: hypothetical protein VGJ41_00065 [Nocardioides sp.]
MFKNALRAACVSTASATLLGAIVGLAGPASADRVIHRDARHDVMKVAFAEAGDELVPAPRVREGDVTRAMIDHRYRRLVVKLRYAELSRDTVRIQIGVLRTDGGRFALVLFGLPDHGNDVVLFSAEKQLTCKGLWNEVDYRENTIKLSVPRRCLDNPEWVRVGVGYERLTRRAAYLDDALSSRVRDNLTMTRRLYRN